MKLSFLSCLIGTAMIGFFGCSEPDRNTTRTPTPAATATPITTPAQTQAGATGAVNPPHGQPGHRCDLAVGAPLDGAPAAQQSNPPMIDMTPRTTPTGEPALGQPQPVVTPTAQPQDGATGAVNPAHGMPGHRCDIAVGAPLN